MNANHIYILHPLHFPLMSAFTTTKDLYRSYFPDWFKPFVHYTKRGIIHHLTLRLLDPIKDPQQSFNEIQYLLQVCDQIDNIHLKRIFWQFFVFNALWKAIYTTFEDYMKDYNHDLRDVYIKDHQLFYQPANAENASLGTPSWTQLQKTPTKTSTTPLRRKVRSISQRRTNVAPVAQTKKGGKKPARQNNRTKIHSLKAVDTDPSPTCRTGNRGHPCHPTGNRKQPLRPKSTSFALQYTTRKLLPKRH